MAAASARDRPDGAASERVRAVATLLLGIHLVGLLLAVAGNSASGTSALVATLRARLLSPWMVPLWLDVGHDTRLTYGLPEDGDHFLNVLPTVSATGVAPTGMRLPVDGDRTERTQRWRRLVRAAVAAEEDADQAGLLPAALAAGLFDAANAEDLTLRFRRIVPPELSLAGATPRVETPLEVRVRRVGGELQVIPEKPAEEMAPVVAPVGSPRPSGAAP